MFDRLPGKEYMTQVAVHLVKPRIFGPQLAGILGAITSLYGVWANF